MTATMQAGSGNEATRWQRFAAWTFLLLGMVFMLSAGGVHAAAPLAGTAIGNQASATYSDASGNAQPAVTSNTVTTTVSQIASFTLTATQTKPGSPGQPVDFPHTLTNTGNGNDTFDLSSVFASGTFTPSGIALYIDANGDGIPDNTTAITSTGSIAPGVQFKFVARVIVPGGALAGQTANVTVSAAGNVAAAGAAYTPAPSQSNTDTVNVTANAVLNLTKAMSATSGADGTGPYTITLAYSNTGNATATAVTIGDVLPAGMSYVSGSGRWSVSGATPLTDNSGAPTDPAGVTYDFGVTTAGKVTAIVASVPSGTSGTVSFQVNIVSGTAPGVISNTGTVTYNDGAGVVGPFNSNTVGFTVNQRASVVLDDIGSVNNGTSPAGGIADSNATADVVGVASTAQGATVQFDNVVHNNGNGSDSFDIIIGANTFPAGTSFALYQSDGVSPLVSNRTPPVAAGATYHVILKAQLPAGSSGTGTPAGSGYTVVKTARSVFDNTKSDSVTDKLDAITASSVDLTNNTARSDSSPAGTASSGNAATTGFGPGTASVVTTQSTNPGTSTTFHLHVNNTSAVGDNYDLSVTSALPSGWTVVFKSDGGAGNCSTTGANITNTGVLNAGTNRLVCAVVTVPAGALAGTTNLTFRAASTASGAQDTKVDAVTVNPVHNLTLTPNNSGQASPGGSVVYTHTVTNGGNVTETVTFPSTPTAFLTDSQVAAGWTSVLYRDNGTTPGTLDAVDSAVNTTTTITLAPGVSETLFVKVFAPNTATSGQVDTTTITVNYNGGASSASATDTTTVIVGNLTLVKEHGLDADCNGTVDTGFGNAGITAKPGQCVRYRITASNAGSANVTSVIVSDATPANTVYNTGAACPASGSAPAATTVGGPPTAPTNCTAGTVSANIGTLTPGQSAVVTFGVQINQ